MTATMMSLLGVAPAYASLALLFTVAGISSAALHAVGPVMAGNLSGKALGRAMSYWMVGGELGRTVGPIVVVTTIGLLSLRGTPWLMLGGLLVSVLLHGSLKDVSGRSVNAAGALPWRLALRHMRSLMMPLLGILVACALMNAALTTYLPTFLNQEGAGLWLAGASLSILQAGGIIGAFAGGSMSDLLSRRIVLFVSLLASPVLTLAFLWSDGWFRIALLPLLGLTSLSATPVVMALVQECLPENRALANGVYMALAFMIRSGAVLLLGGVGDLLGLRQAFTASAVVMLLSVPLIALLPKEHSNSLCPETTGPPEYWRKMS
jgi:FSR family fosmidomycin resistance protein-like MFS transporter